jgi:hypothetical protein
LFLELFNRLPHFLLPKLHWNRLLLYQLQMMFLKFMDQRYHRYLLKLPSFGLHRYHLHLMLLKLSD